MQFNLASTFKASAAAWPADVAVQLPHGPLLGDAGALVKLTFSNWSDMARLKAGQIGALGEAYVEGTLQLEGAMRDVVRAAGRLMHHNPLQADATWWKALRRQARSLAAHTAGKDSAQVQFHYDVSDAFYELWLDPLRVYSCAYYTPLAHSDYPATESDCTLADAQQGKLDHICRKLMLQPGDKFLDIGSGWGGLLMWAAEHYGVDGTGVTLSKNQYGYVTELIAKKGLQHRVQIRLQDYREIAASGQTFDKISSVGMFEHVGRANMTAYFSTIMNLLEPGGLALNHGITAGGLDNAQLGAGMGDFIEKYIFPGGELLHVSAMLAHQARAGLELVDAENLRPHYARTLWDWSAALEAQLGEACRLLALKSNAAQAEKTLRAYRLYLAGSAMCFEQGWLSLHQLLASKPRGSAPVAYPFNRSYMYSQASLAS
jgi:cyclopropane-fatty-acyl-phospholipid synthase